jgi:hypothetical protein
MSSIPSGRRRRLRRSGEVRPSADWAYLPIDALLSVLHKLEPIELMVGGAGRVCRSWRRAVRDEPELWRRIDTRFRKGHRCQIDEDTAKEAVRRGSRRCEAFCGEDATDHFLLFLAEQ